MTHHYYPESTICITVHSWRGTFCGLWQMYNDMYSLIQKISPIPPVFCALPLHLSLPQTLATACLFTVSIVLPFPEPINFLQCDQGALFKMMTSFAPWFSIVLSTKAKHCAIWRWTRCLGSLLCVCLYVWPHACMHVPSWGDQAIKSKTNK